MTRNQKRLKLNPISFLFSLLLLSQSFTLDAQQEEHRVFLLGNLVDIAASNDFSKHFNTLLSQQKGNFTLLLNGDMTEPANQIATETAQIERLKQLIEMLNAYPKGKLHILSGDRDWKNSKKGGHKQVLRLEKEVKDFVKTNKYKNVKWTIKDGCPGPEIYELDDHIVLIAINSQWFNHPFDKPRPADAICDIITLRDFMEELEDAIEDYQDRNILIAAHHPFFSLGNYGGYFSLGDQLKPFPLVGSFRTAYRANIGAKEDISNERLKAFQEGLNSLLFFHENIIFNSGHEKNHQIILREKNYLINSGAPAKGTYAPSNFESTFNGNNAGLICLNYAYNGAVSSTFYSFDKSKGFLNSTAHKLFHSVCEEEANPDNIPNNLSYVPCDLKATATSKMQGTYPDLTTVVAGEEYEAKGWKQFWFGKHYRSSWTQAIQTNYLNLDTTFGGLNILKKGGGRQTTSLKFKTDNGERFTFRSVNKDPSKALNYTLRESIIAEVAKDQTSTQHPYGAMVVDHLLNKLDILHAHPRLFVLPDDLKLGAFRFKYGKLFGMLEENPGKADKNGNRFAGAKKILKSNELFRALYEDPKVEIDYKRFVRARIFDMLIGDWSKHEDNWKWAGFASGDKIIYQPIPRDRDHAFSKLDGFFPWLADRAWGIPNIEGFKDKIPGLPSLVFQARHMDRLLNVKASKADYIEQAKYIQENITDADIDAAMQKLPTEIQGISGAELAGKLKNRIKELDKYALEYYAIMAKEVDVLGTTEKELFKVERLVDGSVKVQIYAYKKEEQGALQFDRTFYPSETKEIRLFGLAKDDVYEVTGAYDSAIKIRLLGGPGDDTYKTVGTKIWIYDKGKETKFETDQQAINVDHWDREIYEYDRLAHRYNTYLPLLLVGFNAFDGFFLRGGASFTRQKFGKRDFSSRHTILGGLSSQGSKSLSYKGRFHHAIGKWDIQLKGSLASPEFYNNFYGVGNNTMIDDALDANGFYEAVYNNYQTSVGVVKQFWKQSDLGIAIGLEHNQSEDVEGTILDGENPIYGANENLDFLSFNGFLDLDFRDSKALAYRGTRLLINYVHAIELAAESSNYGIAHGALEYYASSRNKNPITLGLRLGGAVGYGLIPFYKQVTLGSTSGLRGYTRNRFQGDSSFYFNSELRFQLLESYSTFLPIKLGLKGFFDVGRVYSDVDTPNDPGFHNAYGFGFYIVPLRETFTLSVTLAFSEEESFFPIISMGTPLQ